MLLKPKNIVFLMKATKNHMQADENCDPEVDSLASRISQNDVLLHNNLFSSTIC